MYLQFINLLINHIKLNPYASYKQIDASYMIETYDELYSYDPNKIIPLIDYFNELPILHKTDIIYAFLETFFEKKLDLNLVSFIKFNNGFEFHYWLEYEFLPLLYQYLHKHYDKYSKNGYTLTKEHSKI